MYWRDWRELCGLKFLRLEDFLDNRRHGMCVQLEPQGVLFMEVSSFYLSACLLLGLLLLLLEARLRLQDSCQKLHLPGDLHQPRHRASV